MCGSRHHVHGDHIATKPCEDLLRDGSVCLLQSALATYVVKRRTGAILAMTLRVAFVTRDGREGDAVHIVVNVQYAVEALQPRRYSQAPASPRNNGSSGSVCDHGPALVTQLGMSIFRGVHHSPEVLS